MVWSSCVNGVMETSSHQCVTNWENSQDGKNYFITQVVKEDFINFLKAYTENLAQIRLSTI